MAFIIVPSAFTHSYVTVRLQAQQEPLQGTELSYFRQHSTVLAGGLANSVLSLSEAFTGNYLFSYIGLKMASALKEPEEDSPKPKDPVTAGVVHFGSAVVSKTVASVVTHPLSVIRTWQICQEVPVTGLSMLDVSSLFQTFGEITQSKSIVDGLGAHILHSITETLAVNALEAFCRRTVWPFIQKVLPVKRSALEGRDLAFFYNVIWRNCARAVVNQLIRYAAQLITFPLSTIQYRLEAQGCHQCPYHITA